MLAVHEPSCMVRAGEGVDLHSSLLRSHSVVVGVQLIYRLIDVRTSDYVRTDQNEA